MTTIQDVLKKVREYNQNADFKLIEKAYEVAAEAHKNDKRASGEPYIEHPLNVAYILAEFQMDDESICAALLHDVIEDANYDVNYIKKAFGADVALLVDGVTKITELKAKSREEYQAESLRKMLFATAKDIRVLIIKLCDKLHNMRTLGYLPREKQIRIAKEVMDVYAPLAYRLGIDKIKSELEDLAFKILEPEKYSEIEEKIKKNQKEREEEVEIIKKIVKNALKDAHIEAAIHGRAKDIYSIWRKMQRKERNFDEIYDVIGMRIITKSVKDCYEVLGLIHGMWKPIPRRFKDYIAMPKTNMYQSLHTIAITESGQIVEIQIRTAEMDRIAEEGVAAHWEYKDVKTDDSKFDKKLSWLKQIMDWQKSTTSPQEFVESVEVDFFGNEIYVFTPKGDVIELPSGSTVIDLAYAVHSNLGDRCTGAKINGTFSSIRTELKTGDVVEILTSKNQKPSRNWMKIAKTNKAKQKIRKHLQESGKMPVRRYHPVEAESEEISKNLIITEKYENPTIRLSKCCNPLPGEDIIGLKGKTNIITVHRQDCEALEKGRVVQKRVKSKWKNDYVGTVEVILETVDRVGLFADVLNTIAATGTNVQGANAKIISPDLAECRFALAIDDLEHLKDLINRVKRVQGVKKVYLGKI